MLSQSKHTLHFSHSADYEKLGVSKHVELSVFSSKTSSLSHSVGSYPPGPHKKQQLANKTFRNLGLLCELVFLVLYCSVGDENVY